MEALDRPVTSVTATDIAKAVSSFVVTASAEQMPRICNAIGLFLMIGSSRTSFVVGSAIVVSLSRRGRWGSCCLFGAKLVQV